MAQSVIHLTQSRFYSPVFNAAVFDGPIRIYFAQHQEAEALKIYFQLQQSLKEAYVAFRKNFKLHGQTIFLMIYPDAESFGQAFDLHGDGQVPFVMAERLGEDSVLGVRGPLSAAHLEEVFSRVRTILQAPYPSLVLNPAHL